MDSYKYFQDVTEELVAAWIDGNLSPEEDSTFVDMLSSNEELSAILDSYEDIEADFELFVVEGIQPPDYLNEEFELPLIENGLFDDVSFSNFESDNDEIIEDEIYTEEIPTTLSAEDVESDDYSVDDSFEDHQNENFDFF